MHARKLPRISEPSFDRDYGNGSSSGSKMSKYNRERVRSVSPDGRGMSPRDRSKYIRRDHRERDRDRERDYYRRKQQQQRDRSPRDRKWDRRDRDRLIERDRDDRLDHRENHHQANTSGSGSDSKVRSVGNWSEHTSSSGKIYYYNCVTEVSQWEKPREWVDFERQRSAALKSSQDRRSLSSQKQGGSGHLLSRERSIRGGGGGDLDYDDADSRGSRRDLDSGDPRMQSREQADMDISSSHDTTPTSDESQRHNQRQHLQHHHHQQQQQQQQHESHHYYNDQDKTPPPQQDHSNADGTPSPIGGHTLTPTQNESNENHPNVNNTVASNLIGISSAGLVTSSPLTALKPQVPALTSSLFKFYKEPLIAHVTNWPAEAVERSCQRINEEHLNLSNLGITRVSTELKMARSLVRLAEIQSTLHEQRTLFLRQQILDLEDMRPNLHYMQSSNITEALVPQPQSTPNAQNDQHQHHQSSSSSPLQNTTPIVSSNA